MLRRDLNPWRTLLWRSNAIEKSLQKVVVAIKECDLQVREPVTRKSLTKRPQMCDILSSGLVYFYVPWKASQMELCTLDWILFDLNVRYLIIDYSSKWSVMRVSAVMYGQYGTIFFHAAHRILNNKSNTSRYPVISPPECTLQWQKLALMRIQNRPV